MKSFCDSIQLNQQQVAIPFPLLMRPVLMSDQQFYAVHPYKDSCPNGTTKNPASAHTHTLMRASAINRPDEEEAEAEAEETSWWECFVQSVAIARSFNSRTIQHGG